MVGIDITIKVNQNYPKTLKRYMIEYLPLINNISRALFVQDTASLMSQDGNILVKGSVLIYYSKTKLNKHKILQSKMFS